MIPRHRRNQIKLATRKWEISRSQKRGALWLGYMLRHWNTGRETAGREWWIIMRNGWPVSHQRPRFERRITLARKRADERHGNFPF